jgi:hypothetical protein
MNENKTEKCAEQRADKPTRQLKVRSGMTAGASVEACMENLAYWQNEYYKKCGKVPMPY